MDEDADDPGFPGLPFFAEIAKAFASQGPISWDVARQVAMLGATGGQAVNVDPLARVSIERLAEVAGRRVDSSFLGRVVPAGVRPAAESAIEVTTRASWIHRTLADYRPLFERLAGSLTAQPEVHEDGDDPMAAMIASLGTMVAPAMSGMAIGSMLGQLARRVFGLYDLPIPRSAPEPLLVIADNVDQFATEWSIDLDEMRMWVLVHEMVSHLVVGSPGIRDALRSAMTEYVGAFRPDHSAFSERLGSIEATDADPTAMITQLFSDPAALLGAVRSPEQERLGPAVDAIVAVAVGLVDRAVDETAASVLGSSSRAAEAVRRRRIEASAEERFVEGLLGLRLSRELVELGVAFVDGVAERAGHEGLAPLMAVARNAPTPNELVAPGLWLARIETQDA